MTPVEGIFEDATCRLHMEIPPIRSYNQVRVSRHFYYYIYIIILIIIFTLLERFRVRL